MRKIIVVVFALSSVAALGSAQAAPSFSRVVGFATKTGFRGIVAWQASEPVTGVVRWGTSAGSLTRETLPAAPDTAGFAVLEGLPVGATIHYRIEDILTGARSSVGTFEARNAYADWDAADEKYTLNMLVAVDSPVVGSVNERDLSLEDIGAAVNVMAERLYDALDGSVRLGTVLVTDTALNHPGHVPAAGTLCADVAGYPAGGTPADALIETVPPYDSHTFAGWMVDDPCTGFYVGRRGQLVVNWSGDLHMGYVMTHELIHYAFNAPDLYGGTADCNNAAWDGSIMHNTGGYAGGRWRLSELDRSAALTPCAHGGAPWSWPTLRARWTNVPPAGPPQHVYDTLSRGNADGGELEIFLLSQRAAGLSTLTAYTPVDSPLPY